MSFYSLQSKGFPLASFVQPSLLPHAEGSTHHMPSHGRFRCAPSAAWDTLTFICDLYFNPCLRFTMTLYRCCFAKSQQLLHFTIPIPHQRYAPHYYSTLCIMPTTLSLPFHPTHNLSPLFRFTTSICLSLWRHCICLPPGQHPHQSSINR